MLVWGPPPRRPSLAPSRPGTHTVILFGLLGPACSSWSPSSRPVSRQTFAGLVTVVCAHRLCWFRFSARLAWLLPPPSFRTALVELASASPFRRLQLLAVTGTDTTPPGRESPSQNVAVGFLPLQPPRPPFCCLFLRLSPMAEYLRALGLAFGPPSPSAPERSDLFSRLSRASIFCDPRTPSSDLPLYTSGLLIHGHLGIAMCPSLFSLPRPTFHS